MSLWLNDLVVVIILIVTTELMFRVGRRARREEAMRSQISTVQAATLGLLALILGFTMSMAESRFNGRRQALLLEAAAVGTTYLRADFLPEPGRSESRELLRSYVAARRDYFRASVEQAPAATARAQAIHGELWRRVAAVAQDHPDWDVVSTYVESLNQMIDLEAARDIMIQARLPSTIRILLLLVAVFAVGVTGYATGLTLFRSTLTLYILPILIAVASAVIADLDRTRAGFISTGDRPMERLEQSLARERVGQESPSAPRADASSTRR